MRTDKHGFAKWFARRPRSFETADYADCCLDFGSAAVQLFNSQAVSRMKKASTWYLFAMAVFNLLLAKGTLVATDMWKTAYHQIGVKIPNCTLFMLQVYWWPYIFVGFTLLLALISIRSRWPSNFFYHLFLAALLRSALFCSYRKLFLCYH